ncbi:MAG: hypothetical protein KDD33_05620 [Bdellovibrionales bacterium]|nr:hypothetical protein [Bdellovibrionales bacterium]
MGKPITTAFLLTAGVGSRLRPFTDSLPKPSLPFLNLPMVDYGFYLAYQAGFQNFLFNYHHLPKRLLKDIGSLFPFCEQHELLDETAELLGSGGAIANAKGFLKNEDAFLIANGDELLIPSDAQALLHLREQFTADAALCTLLTCDLPASRKGQGALWVDDSGKVLDIGVGDETTPGTAVHYTGYKIFSRRILDFLPEGESHIFYPILKEAIAHGEKVTTYHISDCQWFESGNWKELIEATRVCLLQYQETPYLKAIHRFYQLNPMEVIQVGTNALMKPKGMDLPHDLKWSGAVVIDEDVSIGPKVELKNVICEKGAQLKGGELYKDQFIFANP